MAKLSINIAKKILLIIEGHSIPFGQLKGKVIEQMIDDGILHVKLQGRSRKTIYTKAPLSVTNFLSSHLGINDLEIYIRNEESGITRAENIIASSNSKTSIRRTFKGFLVNSYAPIKAKINNQAITIEPQEGLYTYIHDYDSFTIPVETLVIGVENPENFRFISKQKHLFENESILFVSRYPQSKDLVTWLQAIPNRYLHFGDFDFEGIRVFRDEYWQYLKSKSSFFIPQNIEELLNTYGNKDLYDTQYKSSGTEALNLNSDIEDLLSLFHNYKKCLEQEVLIEA